VYKPSKATIIRWHCSGNEKNKLKQQSAVKNQNIEDDLQQIDVLFGNLLFQLEAAHLTHTYQVVFRFCQLGNIDYLVLRYLNTGAPPVEEWAEEWL